MKVAMKRNIGCQCRRGLTIHVVELTIKHMMHNAQWQLTTFYFTFIANPSLLSELDDDRVKHYYKSVSISASWSRSRQAVA